MRIARDVGGVSSLFPEGVTRLIDLPYTLHNAILAALQFLTYEELPERERPPKKIWLDPDKMKAWWEDVKRMRKAEMEGHGEQEPMAQNALTKRLLVGFD